jgi:hypothetical protein
VALLTAFTILARWRLDGKGLRDLLRISACAGAPVAALTFAHLVLNRLRFGAWTEFGARYQVGFAFKMGARFIPANLFLYLFQRPELSCRFPYLVAGWNRSRALAPGWLTFAQDYRATEPTIGLLYAASRARRGRGEGRRPARTRPRTGRAGGGSGARSRSARWRPRCRCCSSSRSACATRRTSRRASC